MIFKPLSLVQRILIASLLLLPLAIGFSAALIDKAYVSSLETSEEAALLAQTYALIGSAEPEKQSLTLPLALANPRFETASSGLYARVYKTHSNTEDEALVWQSNSALATLLSISQPPQVPQPGSFIREEIQVNKQAFQRFRFSTIWEIDNRDEIFVFELLSSLKERNREISAYRRILFAWLAGMLILLIATQIIIIRWGLIPIKTLAKEVHAIEKGEQKTISRDYPPELNPLSNNLNTLLSTEEKQRERYKNTLANLAHSLKTPLAVIRSHISNFRPAAKQLGLNKEQEQNIHDVDIQIDRMSDIISHQLKRASMQTSIVSQSQCDLHAIAERIASALLKVYADKNPKFENTLNQKLFYAAEENDMMELFGNLLENAFKYGKGWVKIHSTNEDQSNLNIAIEDNGDGVNDELAPQILVRGARADTTQHGQGIGLAVASEILSHYGGGLDIGKSITGGAQFKVSLPLKD